MQLRWKYGGKKTTWTDSNISHQKTAKQRNWDKNI